MNVVQPDHWKGLCTQRMEGVIDRDFSKTLLMGSMSFSCLNSSTSILGFSQKLFISLPKEFELGLRL